MNVVSKHPTLFLGDHRLAIVTTSDHSDDHICYPRLVGDHKRSFQKQQFAGEILFFSKKKSKVKIP